MLDTCLRQGQRAADNDRNVVVVQCLWIALKLSFEAVEPLQHIMPEPLMTVQPGLSVKGCANDRHRVVIWAESMLQLSQMSDPGVCLVYLVQIVSVDSA